jgi:hypothetical protein
VTRQSTGVGINSQIQEILYLDNQKGFEDQVPW